MRIWLPLLFSAILLLALAGSGQASKAAPEGGDAAGHKDAHGKDGAHKERDMFESALDLGIWTLLVFLLLVVLLGKFAWKPILEGLDQRERAIAAAVEDAKKVKEEAAELRRQLADDRQKANDDARQIREKAQKAAETLIAEGRAAGLAEIQAERDRLHRDIAVARDQVVKETMTQLAQLASAISSKAIRRQLSAEDHRALVDEALAEMNQAVENRQSALGAGSIA